MSDSSRVLEELVGYSLIVDIIDDERCPHTIVLDGTARGGNLRRFPCIVPVTRLNSEGEIALVQDWVDDSDYVVSGR